MDSYTHATILTNGVKLHTVIAGNPQGEPVFLLHGFPDCWYGWQDQIPFLVERGYRVIVPDQRGYNLSDKPKNISDYRISTLAADVRGLIDHFGYERVNLVGHDWGGGVAWWVATLFPEKLKKLVILNVPYPTIVVDNYRRFNLNQLLKSWYIFYFQLPGLPEWGMSMGNWQTLINSVKRSAKPDTFSDEDFAVYRQAWAQPGAMTAMLNWYRAALRLGREEGLFTDAPKPRITTPTLMLWGENDIALDKRLAQASIELCENGKLIYFPDATHWVQHDEAAAVNENMHTFLAL